MNRRQFTASLAALAATPALPLAARMPSVAAPAIPPGAYAWAELIAKAQNTCSPDMLAECLHLKPEVAQVLFKDMVVDGVLQTPGTGGISRAIKPFETSGLEQSTTQRLKSKAKDMLNRATQSEEPRDEPTPLVNQDQPSLGCDTQTPKDVADASPDQPAQESPERG
jgi:hypothetical protein